MLAQWCACASHSLLRESPALLEQFRVDPAVPVSAMILRDDLRDGGFEFPFLRACMTLLPESRN